MNLDRLKRDVQGQITMYEMMLRKPLTEEHHEAVLLMLSSLNLKLRALDYGVSKDHRDE